MLMVMFACYLNIMHWNGLATYEKQRFGLQKRREKIKGYYDEQAQRDATIIIMCNVQNSDHTESTFFSFKPDNRNIHNYILFSRRNRKSSWRETSDVTPSKIGSLLFQQIRILLSDFCPHTPYAIRKSNYSLGYRLYYPIGSIGEYRRLLLLLTKYKFLQEQKYVVRFLSLQNLTAKRSFLDFLLSCLQVLYMPFLLFFIHFSLLKHNTVVRSQQSSHLTTQVPLVTFQQSGHLTAEWGGGL